MDATEEEKIMFQARTIEFIRSLKKMKLGSRFTIKFIEDRDTSPYDSGPKIDASNDSGYGSSLWAENLAHQIFEPLINQGLERYIEEVGKVAEVGKVPERSA